MLDSIYSLSYNVLASLTVASETSNPRNMGVLHSQQQTLASLYEIHSRREGSFLSRREIISHVSAAETDKRIAFTHAEEGTILHQWTRPGGWLGEYWAGDENVTASELGASPMVTDPSDETQIVDRVHIRVVIARVDRVAAAITTAKPVVDTWSIKNQSVDTVGGGEQYYMPIVASAKQGALVIVKPEGATPEELQALEKIAEKNSLRMLSEEEIAIRYGIERFKTPYSRIPLIEARKAEQSPFNPLDKLQQIDRERGILDATRRGHYHEAIEQLETILQDSHDPLTHEILRATLGGLYGAVGRVTEAQELLSSFISFCERPENMPIMDTHNELYLYAKHHLSANLLNPEESIDCLSHLADRIRGRAQTASSSAATTQSNHSLPLSMVFLDLAIRHNQIAGVYSDELTFHDFDENGKPKNIKNESAKQAEEFIQLALAENNLPLQEKIIALTEYGFSLRKQRQYEKTVKILKEAKKALEDYRETVVDHRILQDIAQQHLSLRLGIGLALCRCTDLPKGFSSIARDKYLTKLYEDLNKVDIVTRRFLFSRWIGRNDSDLFMVGWYNGKDDSNHSRGTNLIKLYREVSPIQIDAICTELRENRIASLDLTYLGEPLPTGVSDEDFVKLMDALAVNTSLKKLNLRKFSNNTEASDSNNKSRFVRFAEALSMAQSAGQRLSYLSYYGTRYHQDDAHSMLEFLNHNDSLVVLQASLYDIKTTSIIQEYGNAIQRLPELATLLTGILPAPKAGAIIGKACETNPSFKYLLPFPYNKFMKTQIHEAANHSALFEAKERIESDISPTIVNHFNDLKNEIEKAYITTFRKKTRIQSILLKMQQITKDLSSFRAPFNEVIHSILRMSIRELGAKHPISCAASKCFAPGSRSDFLQNFN